MEITYEQVKALREKTGADWKLCKKAIEYANTHDGCTPVGYLRSGALALATPNMTKEERIKWFSDNPAWKDEK